MTDTHFPNKPVMLINAQTRPLFVQLISLDETFLQHKGHVTKQHANINNAQKHKM